MIIGIHPGGLRTSEYKRWDIVKFAVLAEKVQEKYGANVLIFIGPDEKDLIDKIKDLNQTNTFIYVTDTTLRQTIALIKKCDLFVSNDSGLMHVSTAVGTPTIGIFGPSDPKETGPWGDNNVSITKNLSCSPCVRSNHFLNCVDYPCLKNLSVEEVMDIIEKRLVSINYAKRW